jgi:small-conductance mechanosensitive channel
MVLTKRYTGMPNMLKRIPFYFWTWFYLFASQYTFPVYAEDSQTAAPETLRSPIEISRIIQNSLDAENAQITQIEEQIRFIWETEKNISAELKAYSVLQSTYESLLSLSEAPIDDLKKALASNKVALDRLVKRINDLVPERDSLLKILSETDRQMEKQEEELTRLKSEPSTSPENKLLIKDIQLLVKTLSAKQQAARKAVGAYSSNVDRLTEQRNTQEKVSLLLENRIKDHKTQARMLRNITPLTLSRWSHIRAELYQMTRRLQQLGSLQFWQSETETIQAAGVYIAVVVICLLGGTLILLIRLQNVCENFLDRSFMIERPWLTGSLTVFFRSLPLFGFTLALTLYAALWHFVTLPLINTILNIFWFWLVTQWGLQALNYWGLKSETFISIPKLLTIRLRYLLQFIRWFSTFYLVLRWLMPGESTLVVAARLVFEIGLLLWCAFFMKAARSSIQSAEKSGILRFALPSILYTIGGGGLLLELAGYANFTIYWYISWGQFAAAVFWFTLIFAAMHEWRNIYNVRNNKEEKETASSNHLVQWAMLQVGWLLWIVGFGLAILFAWGAGHGVVRQIIRFLNHSINVGNMQFSLMGVFYAFLVLFLTHLAARICRYIFRTKLLTHSGIEVGLQESITSISAYIVWSFGILIALHAFGFTTATLAVALGAMGIGLGFGLQNIFNNFVSGIILLFERPIQVGDDLEVNGIWATVKKINVRSTVVQTYDNASLIIPNSDLISNQVTNWSFKDRRLRRHVTVGVAYGSDIELVKRTLLEVADKTAGVLKVPKPDVIFTDFGDSALIFKLRIWVYVDHMLKIETDVRFEIDRMFKERGITISFPQRDVHVRQVVEDLSPEPGKQ